MKDLKWVAEGPDDLDNSERARYFCKQEGVERVKVVASQAWFISTKRIEERDEILPFGVNYQVNNSDLKCDVTPNS